MFVFGSGVFVKCLMTFDNRLVQGESVNLAFLPIVHILCSYFYMRVFDRLGSPVSRPLYVIGVVIVAFTATHT